MRVGGCFLYVGGLSGGIFWVGRVGWTFCIGGLMWEGLSGGTCGVVGGEWTFYMNGRGWVGLGGGIFWEGGGG